MGHVRRFPRHHAGVDRRAVDAACRPRAAVAGADGRAQPHPAPAVALRTGAARGQARGAASAPSWSCRSGWPATSAGWRNTGSAAIRSAPWGPPVRPTACGWPRSSRWPTAGSTRRWRRHAVRWQLDLPGLRGDPRLSARNAGKHAGAAGQDGRRPTRPCTFYRVALFHEDLRCEQLVTLAQTLGAAAEAGAAGGHPGAATPVLVPAGRWLLGSRPGGFVFDVEKWAHEVDVPEFEIDAQPVNWGQFVEFVDDGGYDRPEFWLPAGLGMAGARGRAGRPARPALCGADRRGQRRGDADAFRQGRPHGRAARAPCM